ncbi:MAG: hypothetical protein ACI8VY_000658, partial [Cellvibrionaceae bacterium]
VVIFKSINEADSILTTYLSCANNQHSGRDTLNKTSKADVKIDSYKYSQILK